jgi:hypothetical protein
VISFLEANPGLHVLNVHIGLAVTSKTNSKLNTSTFDRMGTLP